ncbi:MAG: thioredoxin family protein [Spirochaetales bacterium]|nr:thioredoxin family protein [Spirochaetales bacterium]
MTKRYVINLVIFIISVSLWAGGSKETKDDMMESSEAMEKDKMMESDVMMKDESDDTMMMLPDEDGFFSTQELQPRVIPFTNETDAQALAKNGAVVYFFGATWCPNCKNFYTDLIKNYKKIPEKVTLIFVNYDTQNKLKQKYGVVTQHSFVQINADGTKKSMWVGSSTVEVFLGKTDRG